MDGVTSLQITDGADRLLGKYADFGLAAGFAVMFPLLRHTLDR
jgi:hypothetical protein